MPGERADRLLEGDEHLRRLDPGDVRPAEAGPLVDEAGVDGGDGEPEFRGGLADGLVQRVGVLGGPQQQGPPVVGGAADRERAVDDVDAVALAEPGREGVERSLVRRRHEVADARPIGALDRSLGPIAVVADRLGVGFADRACRYRASMPKVFGRDQAVTS